MPCSASEPSRICRRPVPPSSISASAPPQPDPKNDWLTMKWAITFERMPVDTGVVVTVAGDQRLQFGGSAVAGAGLRCGTPSSIRQVVRAAAAAHRRKNTDQGGASPARRGSPVNRADIKCKPPQQRFDPRRWRGSSASVRGLSRAQPWTLPVAATEASDGCGRYAAYAIRSPAAFCNFVHLHDGAFSPRRCAGNRPLRWPGRASYSLVLRMY